MTLDKLLTFFEENINNSSDLVDETSLDSKKIMNNKSFRLEKASNYIEYECSPKYKSLTKFVANRIEKNVKSKLMFIRGDIIILVMNWKYDMVHKISGLWNEEKYDQIEMEHEESCDWLLKSRKNIDTKSKCYLLYSGIDHCFDILI